MGCGAPGGHADPCTCAEDTAADIIRDLLEALRESLWQEDTSALGEIKKCAWCGASYELGPVPANVPENWPNNLHEKSCKAWQAQVRAEEWLKAYGET